MAKCATMKSISRSGAAAPLQCFVALVSAASIMAACSRAPTENEFTLATTQRPFTSAKGIYAGMTVKELLHLRPNVTSESYVGYQEMLEGHLVQYQVNGLLTEGQTPSSRAHVRAILAVDTLGNSEEPEAAFATRIKELGLTGAQCVLTKSGIKTTYVALLPHEHTNDYLIVDVTRAPRSDSIQKATAIYGTDLDNPLEKSWAKGASKQQCAQS